MIRRVMGTVASGLAATAMGTAAMAAEQPDYDTVVKDGAFEIRQYAPMIVAEVSVRGDRSRASSAAFDPLFGYISGANVSMTAPVTQSQDIEMTAPVTQSQKIDMTAPVTQSQEIEMTAPVTQSQDIDMTAPVTQSAASADEWVVRFIMPSEWTMETLPRPTNPAVRLVEVSGREMAAVRFSGRGRGAVLDRKEADLRAFIAEQGREPVGAPTYAYYDAPFVPPPFRRNEVMLELAPAG